jgi:hypothetical protein
LAAKAHVSAAIFVRYAHCMAETLYDGPAHGATFYLRADGLVRFRFGNFRASGYVRSPGGALARVEAGTRLALPRGGHTLYLDDTTPALTF